MIFFKVSVIIYNYVPEHIYYQYNMSYLELIDLPDNCKSHPGPDEGEEKYEVNVSPLHIQHRVENIRQESPSPADREMFVTHTCQPVSPLGDFNFADVDVTFLGHDPLPQFLVVRLEAEEVFAGHLPPDHLAEAEPGPG